MLNAGAQSSHSGCNFTSSVSEPKFSLFSKFKASVCAHRSCSSLSQLDAFSDSWPDVCLSESKSDLLSLG